MGIKETQGRIKTAVWQAIAEGDLDLGDVPKTSLEPLIELVTNAAIVELDQHLDASFQEAKTTQVAAESTAIGDEEEILWRGRPFLSLVTEYVITTERVRIFEGLIGKSREDIELIRIQDMDQSQTISERMLNLGDVHLRSHDPSHPAVVLRNIKDPQTVHEILRRAVLDAREKYRLYYREEM
jgi:hypothetical protein